MDGAMVLNKYGEIVADEWQKTPEIRHEIQLDAWVVMPNHFHGIVWIRRGNDTIGHGMGDRPARTGDRPGCRGDRPVRTGDRPGCSRGDRPVAPTGPQPRSLGALMAGFKSAVTKRINQTRNTPGRQLWQRNYWEHIIRNDGELRRIRQYIADNPIKWHTDRNNPGHGNTIADPQTPYNHEPWMV